VSPVEIRKLCPELMQDFLLFFDGDAFADNPKWGFCFCQFLYVDHAKVNWAARTVQENRAAACDRIRSRRMEGYIAYRAEVPIGWCNAAPRTMMDSFADEPDPDASRIGQITCFVVAKSHRRSGVATALLHAACAGLRTQGLEIAEALPMSGALSDAQNHFGPLSMYLAAGFQVHRADAEGRVYVRRSLV
jgi:GNAT superfamily N-acetyltransferase